MLRQSEASSSQPPTIGPSAIAAPAVAPHRPIARARSPRSVNTLDSSDNVAGNTIAAPRPMTARVAINAPGSFVSPAATPATPNTVRPASSMPLRPNRSDRLPAASTDAAKNRLYASTTHCSCEWDACSCRTSVGRATLTIVVSRLMTNAASNSDTRISGLFFMRRDSQAWRQESQVLAFGSPPPGRLVVAMRSYDQYCAMAKSLDVVGDRWTLLIVRELTLRGACRYTDLRNGLPGIATNLLAERLRELEREGVIAREDAPPPIATTLFRLTPRGEQLQPVLEGLTRWGVPLMTEQDPGDAVRSHWLAWALELMLSDRQPEGSPFTVELQTADQPIVIESAGGELRTRLAPAQDPDATLAGPARPILGLLLGLVELGDAEAIGVTFHGDRKVLGRIGAQVLPTP